MPEIAGLLEPLAAQPEGLCRDRTVSARHRRKALTIRGPPSPRTLLSALVPRSFVRRKGPAETFDTDRPFRALESSRPPEDGARNASKPCAFRSFGLVDARMHGGHPVLRNVNQTVQCEALISSDHFRCTRKRRQTREKDGLVWTAHKATDAGRPQQAPMTPYPAMQVPPGPECPVSFLVSVFPGRTVLSGIRPHRPWQSLRARARPAGR